MLLSLAGESNRLIHKGVDIAIALISKPERSKVLRTLWRVKSTEDDLGTDSNKRPDFEELLTNIKLSIWVRRGKSEKPTVPLMERLQSACLNPKNISRFGGLSLGESSHLVNEVRLWRNSDPTEGCLLLPDDMGNLSMPIWPDHVRSKGTRFGQFTLKEAAFSKDEPLELTWIAICPP